VEQNPLGATALPEAVRIAQSTIDDTATTGKLEAPAGGVALRDGEGVLYEPIARWPRRCARPRRAGHPRHGQGRPTTARRSWRRRPAGHSHRATTTIALRLAGRPDRHGPRLHGGRPAAHGAFRFHDRSAIQPLSARRGSGRVVEAERASLEASWPRPRCASSRPCSARSTRSSTCPRPTSCSVTRRHGHDHDPGRRHAARLAHALVQALRAQEQKAATFRTLETGATAACPGVGARGARRGHVRTLWAAQPAAARRDAPGRRLQHVDRRGRVPGRQRPAATRSRSRRSTARERPVADRQAHRPAPGGVVTQALTSPYHVVVIDHQGATGDIYVDG